MFDLSFTPQHLFIGGVAFIAFLFVVLVLPTRRISATPYERMTSILSPAEQHFYKVLSSTIGRRAIIMAKVRIADILKVNGRTKQKHFWSHFSKISQKHIDFVLLDPSTFKTIGLVELDDKSHYQFSRKQRDVFINQVMEQVGIPLYRFRVQRRYDRSEILEELEPSLPKGE